MRIFEVMGNIDADDHGKRHLIRAPTHHDARNIYIENIGKGLHPESVKEINEELTRETGEAVYVQSDHRETKVEKSEKLVSELRANQ
jgi:hypothetical protein